MSSRTAAGHSRSAKRAALHLAAAALAILGYVAMPLHWHGAIAPALADDGGSGDGGGSGGGDGSDNSGPGSGNSGSGSSEEGGEESGETGDDGNGAGAGEAAGDQDRDFIQDEVVVADPDAGFTATVKGLGFVVLDQRPLQALGLTVTRLRVPRGMTAPAARTLLAERFPDLVTDLNELYRPQAQLTLPSPNYAHELIGWGDVPPECGRGLRIGMLDTAVDATWAALAGARIEQRSFLRSDALSAKPDHGTAIAAILVGQGQWRGLLPAAEIDVAEVFARDDVGGSVADVMAVAAGLDWLASQGIPVINLSLSGDRNRLMTLAVERTIARGVIIVAAAGNNGPGAPPAYPAAESGVVAVTAIDSEKKIFSGANQGPYVDFAAPGVRIWSPSATGDGQYFSGTSFAAPFVVAAIAAATPASPAADAEHVVSALANKVEDLGPAGRDPVYGWGLIQAASPCGGISQ